MPVTDFTGCNPNGRPHSKRRWTGRKREAQRHVVVALYERKRGKVMTDRGFKILSVNTVGGARARALAYRLSMKSRYLQLSYGQPGVGPYRANSGHSADNGEP